MFKNLKNLGQLASMLGNAKEMREKVEQMQAELARKTVEAESGAGAVRVTVNGKFDVLAVRFDRPLLATLVGEGDDADTQMIEDLVAAAVNAAMEKARQLAQEEMAKVTGGLDLSDLGGLGEG